MTPETFTAEALRVSKSIRPLLAGRDPAVQGAALADLVSLFIAGHAPELRERMLELHIETVRELVPASAKQIRGE